MARPPLTPVFISYSNKDRAWRDQIAASLKRAELEVLDDTLLRPSQSWPQELQSMRERASVAILIVTQNFLASYTIQDKELPHLLELHKKNDLYLIPVIAEPCDWQQLSTIRDIQAFPQFGRPLASDPGNIAKQLEELAQIIHQLARGADSPPEPRSSSQSKTRSRSRPKPPASPPPSTLPSRPSQSSPSLDSQAAEEVALRLSIQSTQSTSYVAMASLVRPSLAVIPYHVFTQSGLLEDRELPIIIEGPPRARFSTTASVLAADEKANIALLRLAAGLHTNFMNAQVPPATIAPAGRWESYCVTDKLEWIRVGGSAGGPYKSDENEYQTLGLERPMPDSGGVSGAPVIWNGQLIGIVSLANSDGSKWYATLISERTIEELASAPSKPQRPDSWLTQADIERFSPEAREIITRANQLRLERKIRRVHVRDLVRALARQENGQFSRILKEEDVDLELLVRRIPPASVIEPQETSLPPDKLPPMSGNVRRVLLLARDKANAQESKTIEESHVLFGTLELSKHPVIEALKARGITSDKVMFEVKPEPATKSEFLAGVLSDAPAGEDLLDINDEVEALASVLAAKDADPPLALGLFGEWGSGKSFFMGSLESRIRALQDDAQKARKEGVKSSYCEHIVQLTFNAWNYIDSNLWASLATEIFEGLATAVAKRRGGDSAEERALVLAAASSSQEILSETERKKLAAEEELKQTQQKLAILQSSQSNIEASLSPAELFKQAYRFAIAQDEVKKHIEEAAKELQVREGMSAAADIKAEILELRGFWTTLRFTLRHGNLWVWFLVFAAVLGLAWGINTLLNSELLKHYDIPGAAKRIVAILTAVSGFLGMFRIWARKALDFIQKVQKSKQELIEQKKREKTEALETQYKEVQEKVSKAAEAVDSAKQTVIKLNTQLERMRADRQMADYIRQRNESTDYTQHLGIIARVRTDFRHLSTLLQDVKTEVEGDVLEMKQRQKDKEAERKRAKEAERTAEGKEVKGAGEKSSAAENGGPSDKEDELFPRIDRIILYIDDLDRCPKKNVFEVLQAVHLLLAFPLFIVVVGVDPRWLLRSLENQTSVFSPDLEQNGNAGEQEPDKLWQSTPMNYLEKIFQIPFTLRPIDRTGFGKLVDKFASRKIDENRDTLLRTSTLPSPGKEKEPTPVPSDRMAANTISPSAATIDVSPADLKQVPVVAVQTETPATPTIQQPTSSLPDRDTKAAQKATPLPIDRNPEHLQIEEWERKFMKTLHKLIPSPRAGKRFINIYRLIRASMKDTARRKFIGNAREGEYQAAQMLLAILTGYPAEATEILEKLIKEEHPETWGEFLETLKKSIQADPSPVALERAAESVRVTKQGSGNKGAAPASNDAAAPRDQRWTELFDKLDRLQNKLNDMPCKPFCDWATQIARYSFQSGRVMLYQRDEMQLSSTINKSQ